MREDLSLRNSSIEFTRSHGGRPAAPYKATPLNTLLGPITPRRLAHGLAAGPLGNQDVPKSPRNSGEREAIIEILGTRQGVKVAPLLLPAAPARAVGGEQPVKEGVSIVGCCWN